MSASSHFPLGTSWYFHSFYRFHQWSEKESQESLLEIRAQETLRKRGYSGPPPLSDRVFSSIERASRLPVISSVSRFFAWGGNYIMRSGARLTGLEEKKEQEKEDLLEELAQEWKEVAHLVADISVEALPGELWKQSLEVIDPLVDRKLLILRATCSLQKILSRISTPGVFAAFAEVFMRHLQESQTWAREAKGLLFVNSEEKSRWILSHFCKRKLQAELAGSIDSSLPLSLCFRQALDCFVDEKLVGRLEEALFCDELLEKFPDCLREKVKDLVGEALKVFLWRMFEERLMLILCCMREPYLDLSLQGMGPGSLVVAKGLSDELMGTYLSKGSLLAVKKKINFEDTLLSSFVTRRDIVHESSLRLESVLKKKIHQVLIQSCMNRFAPVLRATLTLRRWSAHLPESLVNLCARLQKTCFSCFVRGLRWYLGEMRFHHLVRVLKGEDFAENVAKEIVNFIQGPHVFNIYLQLLDRGTLFIRQGQKRFLKGRLVPVLQNQFVFKRMPELYGKVSLGLCEELLPSYLKGPVFFADRMAKQAGVSRLEFKSIAGKGIMQGMRGEVGKKMDSLVATHLFPGLSLTLMLCILELRLVHAFKERDFSHSLLPHLMRVTLEGFLYEQCPDGDVAAMKTCCQDLLQLNTRKLMQRLRAGI